MVDLHTRRRIGPDATGSALLQSALADVQTFGRLPGYRRRQIERTIDELIAFLDTVDGDPDREPEEDRGELDQLPDDNRLSVFDVLPLCRSNLFARAQGVRHG
ncbi:hypothetical protein [Azospirillum sp. TSO22-1]|uniref:hypothetical protein n=1 Tax=Azospirillum sp. TSO22-1 TaxID=716789 RepID=UPI000D61051B|nr:hypothetical protein [Azospirillum sp. TSO22-1]PWC53138.1 hypothetical protein TSO221_11435 [Azospirillum sp. TSO22-1]